MMAEVETNGHKPADGAGGTTTNGPRTAPAREPAAWIDLDVLAKEIYALMKAELRIERERRGPN
jgi:hypothetical protein